MCPFAVAGLGFKYGVATSSGLRLGHPLRNPLRIAFKRDDIVGLHTQRLVGEFYGVGSSAHGV